MSWLKHWIRWPLTTVLLILLSCSCAGQPRIFGHKLPEPRSPRDTQNPAHGPLLGGSNVDSPSQTDVDKSVIPSCLKPCEANEICSFIDGDPTCKPCPSGLASSIDGLFCKPATGTDPCKTKKCAMHEICQVNGSLAVCRSCATGFSPIPAISTAQRRYCIRNRINPKSLPYCTRDCASVNGICVYDQQNAMSAKCQKCPNGTTAIQGQNARCDIPITKEDPCRLSKSQCDENKQICVQTKTGVTCKDCPMGSIPHGTGTNPRMKTCLKPSSYANTDFPKGEPECHQCVTVNATANSPATKTNNVCVFKGGNPKCLKCAAGLVGDVGGKYCTTTVEEDDPCYKKVCNEDEYCHLASLANPSCQKCDEGFEPNVHWLPTGRRYCAVKARDPTTVPICQLNCSATASCKCECVFLGNGNRVCNSCPQGTHPEEQDLYCEADDPASTLCKTKQCNGDEICKLKNSNGQGLNAECEPCVPGQIPDLNKRFCVIAPADPTKIPVCNPACEKANSEVCQFNSNGVSECQSCPADTVPALGTALDDTSFFCVPQDPFSPNPCSSNPCSSSQVCKLTSATQFQCTDCPQDLHPRIHSDSERSFKFCVKNGIQTTTNALDTTTVGVEKLAAVVADNSTDSSSSAPTSKASTADVTTQSSALTSAETTSNAATTSDNSTKASANATNESSSSATSSSTSSEASSTVAITTQPTTEITTSTVESTTGATTSTSSSSTGTTAKILVPLPVTKLTTKRNQTASTAAGGAAGGKNTTEDKAESPWIVPVIVILVLVILFLLILVLIVFFARRRRGKKTGANGAKTAKRKGSKLKSSRRQSSRKSGKSSPLRRPPSEKLPPEPLKSVSARGPDDFKKAAAGGSQITPPTPTLNTAIDVDDKSVPTPKPAHKLPAPPGRSSLIEPTQISKRRPSDVSSTRAPSTQGGSFKTALEKLEKPNTSVPPPTAVGPSVAPPKSTKVDLTQRVDSLALTQKTSPATSQLLPPLPPQLPPRLPPQLPPQPKASQREMKVDANISESSTESE